MTPLQARISVGLTQTEAAQLIGVTRRTWSNIEKVAQMQHAQKQLFFLLIGLKTIDKVKEESYNRIRTEKNAPKIDALQQRKG